MSWFIFATTGYFLGALTVILDKYLLGARRISTPAVYAFYVCLAGMLVLFFAPLGWWVPNFQVTPISAWQFVLALFSGVTFTGFLVALYGAIQKSEASKVTPIVFSLVPLVTLGGNLVFGTEVLSGKILLGVGLLLLGGLLISFDLPLKLNKRKFFAGFYLSLGAGLLQGFSFLALKHVYFEQSFFSGYVWTRGGAFVGAFLLLLVPAWRRQIWQSLRGAHKKKQENVHTAGLFFLNKIFGGSSSALINLAIAAGSVTLVSALISAQYVFVLVLALLFGKHLPQIFEERLYFWDWAQKVLAIGLIAVGIYLIS